MINLLRKPAPAPLELSASSDSLSLHDHLTRTIEVCMSRSAVLAAALASMQKELEDVQRTQKVAQDALLYLESQTACRDELLLRGVE